MVVCERLEVAVLGIAGVASVDGPLSPNRSISGFAFLEGACGGCVGADVVRNDADLSNLAFSCTMFRGWFRQPDSPAVSPD